jgi:Uma2 family endonuclease
MAPAPRRKPSHNRPEVEAAWRAVSSEHVAEIIGGELRVSPRPAPRHQNAATVLGEELGPPFRRGRGGPGGWVFLDKPELHQGPAPDRVVPEVAGWRRERMPEFPETAAITLAPDWICEVLSDSTEAVDRAEKMPVYAREGVRHVWLVDPRIQTLEVFRLEGDGWRWVITHRGDATVRVEPFDAIELSLSLLWTA